MVCAQDHWVIVMKKFLVVSGFLGAGKTTFMIALSREFSRRAVLNSIIANDLGAKDLIDAKFTEKQGCAVSELGGACICYQTENLVDRLRLAFDDKHCEFVMSDIPGCGVGALEHVYGTLEREYPGEFELAPFTVVVDAHRLSAIMPCSEEIGLPQEINYLFRAQLMEADLILLNKIDSMRQDDKQRCLDFLRTFCPQAAVHAISAKTGEGMQAAAKHLLTHSARLEPVDIGYGSEEFLAAESCLCWYDRQYYAKVCCDVFDPDAYLTDLVEQISEELGKAGRNVPHLKVYAETENGFAKLSRVGIDQPIEVDSCIGEECVDIPVIINARAACEPKLFSEIVDVAMQRTAEKYKLEITIFFTECFGVVEESENPQ